MFCRAPQAHRTVAASSRAPAMAFISPGPAPCRCAQPSTYSSLISPVKPRSRRSRARCSPHDPYPTIAAPLIGDKGDGFAPCAGTIQHALPAYSFICDREPREHRIRQQTGIGLPPRRVVHLRHRQHVGVGRQAYRRERCAFRRLAPAGEPRTKCSAVSPAAGAGATARRSAKVRNQSGPALQRHPEHRG